MNRVTITGADDNTPVSELIALSAEFPYVEWGILVSRHSEGHPRFPSRKWQANFAAAINDKIALSMHICGGYVREILSGGLPWEQLPAETAEVARRIQLNTHAEPHVTTVGAFSWMLARGNSIQFIIQLDGVNDHILDAAIERGINAVGLSDKSHGAGVLPEIWPDPHRRSIYHGYAGGLGPENVAAEIAKMTLATHEARVHRNLEFWIDMEGRVRDNREHLDLAKVRQVLEICRPLITK
jgi:hypothetical protein